MPVRTIGDMARKKKRAKKPLQVTVKLRIRDRVYHVTFDGTYDLWLVWMIKCVKGIPFKSFKEVDAIAWKQLAKHPKYIAWLKGFEKRLAKQAGRKKS